MSKFKVGDIVRWDRAHPDYHLIVEHVGAPEPMVVELACGNAIRPKRLDGEDFVDLVGKQVIHSPCWWSHRFVKDVFMTAAKEASDDV